MRLRSLSSLLALVLVGCLSACGVTRGEDPNDILMIIPNSPGGGYDLTGRAAVDAMRANDVTGSDFTVENVIGAGGTRAMGSLMGQVGDEHTMMTVGLGVVGSLYSFANDYRLDDATPLAQLMSEPEAVFVPADSPYENINDLLEAWKADPGAFPVGGGSSPGGPDHLFPMQLAQVAGIDPNEVNFVTYDGGGPLKSALLGKKIGIGFSGPGELLGYLESGELRALAVSGAERSPQAELADVPTLTEEGVDLVFVNWRGVLGPPDISEETADRLIGYLEKMHETPEWQETLETNGWTDDFKTGDEFRTFLEEQDRRVSDTLTELGLL